jgi:hypothetical protein
MQTETKNLYGLIAGIAAFGDIKTDGGIFWKAERQAVFSFIANGKVMDLYKVKPSGEVKRAKSTGIYFLTAGLTTAVMPFRQIVADTVKALSELATDSEKYYEIAKKDGSIKTTILRRYDAKERTFTFDIANKPKAMAFKWTIKKTDLIDGLQSAKLDADWTVESLTAAYAAIEPKAGAATKAINKEMAEAIDEF